MYYMTVNIRQTHSSFRERQALVMHELAHLSVNRKPIHGLITYNILYRQDNGEKIHAHKNFTGYYKNQDSDEMVHTIRSRFAEQRNPMHTCINRLINGFKILIQLLKLVAAKDLAGRRLSGRGLLGIDRAGFLFHALSTGRWGCGNRYSTNKRKTQFSC